MMFSKKTKKRFGKFAILSQGAYACWPPGTSAICVDTKVESLTDLLNMISDLITGAIAVSALVAVILLVYAGYNYIISMGDPDKITTSQKMVTNTIIGLVIIMISGLIIKFVIEVVI